MATQLSSPPLPVSAIVNVSGATWSVTFDQPLDPGFIVNSQFQMFSGVGQFNALGTNASGNTVGGFLIAAGASAIPPQVRFVDSAGDLTGTTGLQVADFQQPAVVT